MTLLEWIKLLQIYKTPQQVISESLEGLNDHLRPCVKDHTVTVVKTVPSLGARTPFVEEPPVCNRGTKGCNLHHDDLMALYFAKAAFERVEELQSEVEI